MNVLSWVDGRTLLACQAIVIGVFSVMLAGMRWLNPGLRGIPMVALGFFLGLPATLLLASFGHLPAEASAAGGGALILASSLFLFRGVLDSSEARGLRTRAGFPVRPERRGLAPEDFFPVLCGLSLLALVVLIYFTTVQVALAPCVFALTGTLAVSRGLLAWTLFRGSAGRRQMWAFAFSMAVFAGITLMHALATLRWPDAPGVLGPLAGGHTVGLLASVFFFCVQGVFYLLMFAGEVTEVVQHEAQHDHLSGALNRRGIEDALRSEVARARRTGGTFSVMLIDVDEFKQVNDRHGHTAGDEALRLVALGLGRTVRAYDTLGRFGGDEFLLLLPETSGETAMSTTTRIREAVLFETATAVGGALTLSIGVTCTSGGSEPPLEIVRRADAALYEAKRAGRDCARLRLLEPREARVEADAARGGRDPLPRGAKTV